MTDSNAPHPRILFESVPRGYAIDELKALAGTHGQVGLDVNDVHDSDWDLVVSFAQEPYAGTGLHVLSFGGDLFPMRWYAPYNRTYAARRHNESHARDVQLASGADTSELRSLLDRTVIGNDPGAGRRRQLTDVDPSARILVTIGVEEYPWAAVIHSPTHGTYTWALPKETSGHVEWLAYVLRWLSANGDDRFPKEADWRLSREWATPEVSRHAEELKSIDIERQNTLRDLDLRESEARRLLELKLGDVDEGPQRLLTADGEALSSAVADVLTYFGFTVVDMDAIHTVENGARLEDLQVTLSAPTDEDWRCLVEVKGYSRGAKASDVGQIYGRPARAYLKRHGKDADALWHIVNVWKDRAPSDRPQPFTGKSDLLTLADNGGCAIDTRHLYRAWKAVVEGRASVAEIRTSLMHARELWTWKD